MRNYLLILIFISLNSVAFEAEIAKLFAKLPFPGAIVVANLDGTSKYVYNEDRASSKFTVASTFKIPNTLIGLEEKAVSNKLSKFVWSGKKYEVKSWNKNQTLESAFKVSCVWCYQEIARKVGAEKYLAHLSSMKYGNLPKVFAVDEFWLDGSLQLSAYDQVAFLKRLYKREFLLKPSAYITLKEIMLVEKNPQYSIYAKTGWAPYGESPVGWYVGYVESAEQLWFFASNLEITNIKDLKLRKEVVMDTLKIIGAIN